MTSEWCQIRGLYACKILGKDAAEAVPAITGLLVDSQDKVVQISAAKALGAIGPAAASSIPELTKLMEGGAAMDIRRLAARALGGIGPAAIPVLKEAVRKQSVVVVTDGRTNDYAAQALETIRGKNVTAINSIPPEAATP